MNLKTIVALLVIFALACLIAAAGSTISVSVAGYPLFASAVLLIFAIQWLAFVPAWLLHTERFYDLAGGLTYLSVVVLILCSIEFSNPRAQLLGILVAIWAIRLSGFLFIRVIKDGFDRRFTVIKTQFGRFLVTWNLQALWVTMTGAAAYTAMSSDVSVLDVGNSVQAGAIGVWAIAGTLVWLAGFLFEAVADEQKRRFRSVESNHQRFIQTGLWAKCRHPNYFGEIVLWTGVAIVAAPALSGWAYITLISPIFVYVLLTRVSGIPLLEASAKKRWGDSDEYQRYLQNTPRLIPFGR